MELVVFMQFIYCLFAYMVGTIMVGYWVIKVALGQDIRTLGSGNVGARNVGRLLGKKGFVITMVGDGLKGVVAIFGAQVLGFSTAIQALAMLAVVIGHIWPVTLQFKGGKGIATFIGALLLFDAKLVLGIALICLVLLPLFKSFTLAGLVSFLTIPVIMAYYTYSLQSIIIVAFVISLTYLAHKHNIKEKLKKRR